MALAVYFSIRAAYKARPVYAPDSAHEDSLNRYQAQLEPVRRVVMLGVPIVFGLFAGTAAMAQWEKVMLFLYRVPFGTTDPEFGMDVSFYTNTLPFLGFATGMLISRSVPLTAGCQLLVGPFRHVAGQRRLPRRCHVHRR